MVVLCCILVVTGFLPSPISRSSLSSPPSQVFLHDSQAGRATSQRATPRPHARHQMLLAALGL